MDIGLPLPRVEPTAHVKAAFQLIVLTPEVIALGTAVVAAGHRVASDPYFVDDAGDAAEAVLDCAESLSVGTCVVAAVQVATAAIPGNTAQSRPQRQGMAGAVQKGFDEAVEVLGELGKGKRYVDLPTSRASSPEAAADLREYAKRSNAVIEELGPQTVQSTKGGLRAAASRDAAAERARASAAGSPYDGQAGHVPDTAVTGQSSPPGGYLNMRGNSNGIAGGCIGNCVGQTIDGFTVDGEVP